MLVVQRDAKKCREFREVIKEGANAKRRQRLGARYARSYKVDFSESSCEVAVDDVWDLDTQMLPMERSSSIREWMAHRQVCNKHCALCTRTCALPSHHLGGDVNSESHYCEQCLRNYTDQVISSRDLESIQVSVMREQLLKGKLKRDDDDHDGTGDREGACLLYTSPSPRDRG